MSRPLFHVGFQYMRVREGWYGPIGATDATTILDEFEWPDIVHHPAAPERVAETAHSTTMSHEPPNHPFNPGSYPIRPSHVLIERSRVDALERRADTRDTMLVDMRNRLDALETARAWIDTQEVKARMDNHNERLRNLQDRITEIEKVAEAASRFFKLSPKGD